MDQEPLAFSSRDTCYFAPAPPLCACADHLKAEGRVWRKCLLSVRWPPLRYCYSEAPLGLSPRHPAAKMPRIMIKGGVWRNTEVSVPFPPPAALRPGPCWCARARPEGRWGGCGGARWACGPPPGTRPPVIRAPRGQGPGRPLVRPRVVCVEPNRALGLRSAASPAGTAPRAARLGPSEVLGHDLAFPRLPCIRSRGWHLPAFPAGPTACVFLVHLSLGEKPDRTNCPPTSFSASGSVVGNASVVAGVVLGAGT